MLSKESSGPSSVDPEFGSKTFWECYFSGRLISMHRKPGTGYGGRYEQYVRGRMLPEEHDYQVTWDDIKDYPYADDRRFGVGVYPDFAQALRAVISSSLMDAESVPMRDQLALAASLCAIKPVPDFDYRSIRKKVLERLETRSVSIDSAISRLASEAPDVQSFARYEEDGDTCHLRVDRQVIIKSLALLLTEARVNNAIGTVAGSEYEADDTVRIAMWAIGRHNEKSAVNMLIAWLKEDRYERFSVAIERALQSLCSGERLLEMQYDEPHTHWVNVQKSFPQDQAGWEARDANSCIWEKRLRLAATYAVRSPELALRFADDEVLPVRRAVDGMPA